MKIKLFIYLFIVAIVFTVLSCFSGTDPESVATNSSSSTVTLVPPSNFTGEKGDKQVTLSWDTVLDAEYYVIYWTNDGTNPVQTQPEKITNLVGVIQFIHDDLVNKIEYRYALCYVKGGVESAITSVISVTPVNPVLSKPTGDGLFANSGYKTVVINWDDVNEADTYNIYWVEGTGTPDKTSTKIEHVSPPYYHTGLTNDQTYSYVVSSVDTTYDRESEVSAKIVYGAPHVVKLPDQGTWTFYGYNPMNGGPYQTVLYDPHGFDGTELSGYKYVRYDNYLELPDIIVWGSDDGVTWTTINVCQELDTLVYVLGIPHSVGPEHSYVVYNKDGWGDSVKFKMWLVDAYAQNGQDVKEFYAESTDGVNWTNVTMLKDTDTTIKLDSYFIGNAQDYLGPAVILYNASASNTGYNPTDYTYFGYWTRDLSTTNWFGGTVTCMEECSILAYSEDGKSWKTAGNTDTDYSTPVYDYLTGSGSGVLPHASLIGTNATWDSNGISNIAMQSVVALNGDADFVYYGVISAGTDNNARNGVNFMTSTNFTDWTFAGDSTSSTVDPVACTYGSFDYPTFDNWHDLETVSPFLLYDPNKFGSSDLDAPAFKLYFAGKSISLNKYYLGYAYAEEGSN